jgi:hypothetical protein
MSEKWVSIELDLNELLHCRSCREDICEEQMHLYINVDDEVEDILCDRCWKKKQKEIKE